MTKSENKKNKIVLQLCYDYTFPYLDVARQYASLFKGTDFKVVTVFLVGKKDGKVAEQIQSDEVVFLENQSKDLRGLKLKQIRQLKELSKKYKFVFAIAHRYQAIYISKHIKKLPVIGVNHSFGKFRRFTRRWFLNRHKKNLFLLGVSNAVRDEMRSVLHGFPEEQIQTLYNRINVEQLKAQQVDKKEAREYLNLEQDKYVIANVGRLHPDKDQKTLINAFSRISDQISNALLVIIGKGRLENELRQQIKKLKLEKRVLLLGVVPQAVNYFKAFDNFVLSSDHEPFGMVLLEAIIAGVPVISTNAGGAKEIITDPEWLFEVGGDKKLSELMLRVYQLDKSKKDKINKHNQLWLNRNFTDKSVKKRFWLLPFIKNKF